MPRAGVIYSRWLEKQTERTIKVSEMGTETRFRPGTDRREGHVRWVEWQSCTYNARDMDTETTVLCSSSFAGTGRAS